jgi:hypothetical protein
VVRREYEHFGVVFEFFDAAGRLMRSGESSIRSAITIGRRRCA